MTKFSPKNILITGGTGSFGKAFINYCIRNKLNINRIVIYSRDELKQWEMQKYFPEDKFPQLRFFIGDVRDRERLLYAFENIDTVIHAAALKQVPTGEYNPMECIKTNILGAENVINACFKQNIKRVIALSTDKAAAPANLYGATKLCSDKLFVAANNMKGSKEITFSVVRYGNVMGSRGSVIPLFLENAKTGVLKITDPEMTRFNITLKEAILFVFNCLERNIGGEIFVPKIPSYKITDVADAISPNSKRELLGLRPGEKIHEEMITKYDAFNTIDLGKYYAILPSNSKVFEEYTQRGIKFSKVSNDFAYNSGENEHFLTIKEIQSLIKKNIDIEFKPI